MTVVKIPAMEISVLSTLDDTTAIYEAWKVAFQLLNGRASVVREMPELTDE